jgi:hypothetical protein
MDRFQKTNIEIFSIEMVVKCGVNPESFGFAGETIAKTRMALLRYLVIFSYFSDVTTASKCIGVGGLSCLLDIACAHMVTQTQTDDDDAAEPTGRGMLPQYDTRHKLVLDDTSCRCRDTEPQKTAYSSTVMSLLISTILSLCGDPPDFIRTRIVPANARAVITVMPGLIGERLKVIGKNKSMYIIY